MAQFEAAFREEAEQSVVRREYLRKRAADRSRARSVERIRKRGNLHFTVLALAILATAVIVTIVMFQALALLVS
jgi:predicted N-acetyltransferase YhbS